MARDKGRHRAITTSPRAWVSPTTCSAPARQRSNSTPANTSRPPSTATATTRRYFQASRIDLTQNRAWTDSNGNYIPDCDLLNGAAQNLTATGGDICGAWANPNFGKPSMPTATPIYSLGYAEKILRGWGTRPSDWQIGVTLQQEILPRVSIEVGYSRRWLQNFTVTDNLAIGPSRLR